MDERTFAAAVGDWLQATDAPLPDADANVHAAVARAARTPQSAPRRGPIRIQRTRMRDGYDGGRSILVTLVAAVAVMLVVGSVALKLMLEETERQQTEPIAASGPDGIDWRTERVDLRADAFRLEADGRTFTMAGTPLRIETDEDALSMAISWTEDGSDLAVSIGFGYLGDDRADSDGGAWWVAEAGAELDGETFRSAGPFLKTPLGEAYRGDVELELGAGPTAITLAFDGLDLTVQPPPEPPWWRGAGFLGFPIPDFIGPLLPGPAKSEPTPETRTEPTSRAYVPFGEVMLSGKLRPSGVFRVTSDDAGHTTHGVADVAVGPGGAVWVALRDGAIYRLGERGSVAPDSHHTPVKPTRIEALADGGLLGYSKGAAWRLVDGSWNQLPDRAAQGVERYDTRAEALDHLDGSPPPGFLVGGIAPDGTIWGHGETSERVEAILPDTPRPPRSVGFSAIVDPALATVVGGMAVTGERLEQGVIRVTSAEGQVIEDVKDVVVDGQGDVWVAHQRELLGPGRPERIADGDGGPGWIDRLSLDGQGRLVVSGDGYWRLQDGSWTDLSAPIRGLGTVDALGRQTVDGVVVAGVDGDRKLWGVDDGNLLARWADDGWVRYELPVLFPSRSPQAATGPASLQASIDPGGDVWVQLPHPRLARFDGTKWSELDIDMATVVGDPDARLVAFMPTRGSTAWLFARADDGEAVVDYVARYADGSWTPYRVDAIVGRLGGGTWKLAGEPRSASDGRSVVIPILQADGEVDIVFDGAKVTMVGPLPSDFTWTAIGQDGSIWGIGPERRCWSCQLRRRAADPMDRRRAQTTTPFGPTGTPTRPLIAGGRMPSSHRDPEDTGIEARTFVVIRCRGAGETGARSGWDMDPELVRRAQQGDEAAYAAITQAVGDRFLQVAYQILRDRRAVVPHGHGELLGHLGSARSCHTSKLLVDGTILVVGGAGDRRKPVLIAELVLSRERCQSPGRDPAPGHGRAHGPGPAGRAETGHHRRWCVRWGLQHRHRPLCHLSTIDLGRRGHHDVPG